MKHIYLVYILLAILTNSYTIGNHHTEASTVTPLVKQVKQIKETEPIPTPEPAPEAPAPPTQQTTAPVAETPPAPSGCVTGYSTGQYALDQIIAHESGGRSCAENAGGCYGLLQACPGAPLKLACGGDPECQINWFTAHKLGARTWDDVWSLWQTQGWW